MPEEKNETNKLPYTVLNSDLPFEQQRYDRTTETHVLQCPI